MSQTYKNRTLLSIAVAALFLLPSLVLAQYPAFTANQQARFLRPVTIDSLLGANGIRIGPTDTLTIGGTKTVYAKIDSGKIVGTYLVLWVAGTPYFSRYDSAASSYKSMAYSDSTWWWNKRDSASTPGVPTVNRFLDSLNKVLKLRDSTLYVTHPLWADSLARLIRTRDSNSVYATYPRMRDSLQALRTTINTKLPSSSYTKQHIIDSLNAGIPDTVMLTRQIGVRKTGTQLSLWNNQSAGVTFAVSSAGRLNLAGIGAAAGWLQVPKLGVGTTSAAFAGISVAPTLTGADQALMYGAVNFDSTASSSISMFALTGYTANTSSPRTITNVFGLYLNNLIAGTNTVVTNQYQVYLLEPTVGTNKYAIYSLGGQSYHAGNFGIGVIPSAKLHVQSTTEPQAIVGYDVNNYFSATVSAIGNPTFHGTGDYMSFNGKAGDNFIPIFSASGAGNVYLELSTAGGGWEQNVSAAGDYFAGFYGSNAGVITAYSAGSQSNTLVLNLGRVGVGVAPLAKLHIQSTTTPQRINGYDVSNYLSETVASTGGTAFAITSSNGTPTFTFNKDVNVTGALTATTLSSFSANGGIVAMGAGDSAQVTITGLTIATGVAVVSYASDTGLTDAPACWRIWAADKLSIYGTNGLNMSWAVIKK